MPPARPAAPTTAGRSSLSDGSPVTVAVDLLGGDHAPEAVLDGVRLALAEDPALRVMLVGPPGTAQAGLAARDLAGACATVPATQVVGMAEDPARAVRAKRDATVRVAARLVRDRAADAAVSVGSSGAAMAAAVFTVGRLPGVTRPPLAVALPTPAGPVVLCDVGATVEATPDLLLQFALSGAAYAATLVDRAPRVGLLNVGGEPGKGDLLRKEAEPLLAEVLAGTGFTFVGNVEGHDIPLGGPADVVVCDGFTGNVALKAVEGTYARLGGPADEASPAPPAPEAVGGALLLGVPGVFVVGHGASGARAVAACIALAARTVRSGVVTGLERSLAGLVRSRRIRAGLPGESR